MKKSFLQCFFLLLIFVSNYAQTHVNTEWDVTNGSPLGLEWSSSITNNSNQLLTVGNTSVTGQGANILLTKYNNDGIVAWQTNINTSGNKNDYGIALCEDNQNNIYVVGTTDNNSSNNYDLVIIKCDALGTLLWSQVYNSIYNKNDIATSLKVDANGNVFVAATSESTNTSFDYLVLKFTSLGNLLWSNRYDYANLIEIPISIDVNDNGDVFLAGASGSTANNWDYTIAKFSSAGVFLSDIRNTVSGNGLDHPIAYKKDNAGNIYITGKASSNGVNYDIKTVKFNSNFILQWSKTLDFASKEDVGNTLDVDANGNVYVGGYITLSNNLKQALVVKYDLNGNEIWQHKQSSSNPNHDAQVKSIDVLPSGEIYVLGQDKGDNGSLDLFITKMDNIAM